MNSSSSSSPGFTLVEALAVMAILAILIMLIFPAFMDMLERSWAAKCMGNLKQIHQGIMLYVADNNGRMPRYREGNYDANGAWIRGVFWYTTIKPYIDDARQLYLKCPAEKRDLAYHYALNNTISYEPRVEGERFQTVELPSRRFLVADNNSTGGDGSRIEISTLQDNVAFRHPGKRSNILFLDGHMESLLLENLPVPFNGFKKSDSEYKAFSLGKK